MLKILIKTAILVFIVFSVYFIVNPSACSNLMLGRVVNSTDKEPVVEAPSGDHSELFVPAGDRGTDQPATYSDASNQTDATAPDQTAVATDTRSSQPEEIRNSSYSQEDIDYAIASRYVELENEYIQKNKINKDSAKEISYQVMDDFELTPQEWESFLQRATQTNLFNQIRAEMSTGK